MKSTRPTLEVRAARPSALVGGRSAFSLVEILVVMSIIAFLSAALIVVLPRVINASKIAATRATITKLDGLLQDRINGFKRWIQNQDRIAGAGVPSYAVDSMTEAGNNLALAKVLGIKKRFREHFGQIYGELGQTLTSNNPRGASHQPLNGTDSGECLWLVLTKGALFDTEPPSASDLRAIEVADTDGDGLAEPVDAWGHPLRFYRWPTRLIRAAATANSSQQINGGLPGYSIQLNPQFAGLPGATSGLSAKLLISALTISSTAASNFTFAQELSQPMAKDPDDPLGLIDMVTNGPSPQSSSTNATNFEHNYHTPDTYFVPLIVSGGPDEQLGLFEPDDTTNFGYLCQPRTDLSASDPKGLTALFDNITNQQQ